MKAFLFSLHTLFAVACGAAPFHATPADAIAQAHQQLVTRFLSPQGLLYDYIGELPTPRDCAEGRPNALGWWSPIENGPMFTGPWLSALCRRPAPDRELCERLARGLLLAASVSDVPGMIVRGFGTDGRCHYPVGSIDQTVPWLEGLYTYYKSGLAPEPLRNQIKVKVTEVFAAIEQAGWRCPCDGVFKGEFRGNFAKELPFRAAAHYLFTLRALHVITGEGRFLTQYRQLRDAPYLPTGETRVDILEKGMMVDKSKFPCDGAGIWIYVGAQACLAELCRLEEDAAIKARYRRGLEASAAAARPRMQEGYKWQNKLEKPFKYANWRNGYNWREQKTQKDAEAVANSAKKEVLGGDCKWLERALVTNPLAAAAICSAADLYKNEIDDLLRHYDFSSANLSEFFLAELTRKH